MWRPASRRLCSVPVRALVISFSTNGRSSLAFASVVSIAPWSMSDDARLRINASFCSLVRRSCRPALRCRIGLLLHVVGRGRGGAAGRSTPVEHAHAAVAVLLEPHSEVQSVALEEIGDLLQRLLSKILHLENLTLGLPHEVAQRPDVRVLERVHGANGELEIVDRGTQQGAQFCAVCRRRVGGLANRRRRMGTRSEENTSA